MANTRKRQRTSVGRSAASESPDPKAESKRLAKNVVESSMDSEDEDEIALRESLFGVSSSSLVERYEVHADIDVETADVDNTDEPTDLFAISTAPQTNDKDSDSEAGEEGSDGDSDAPAAWVDDDDEGVTVNISAVSRLRKLRTEDEVEEAKKDTIISAKEYEKRLRGQHRKVYHQPEWAKVEDGDDDHGDEDIENSDDSDDEDSHSSLINDGKLAITRVRDANQHSPSNAVVQCTSWHKNGQLFLTAGLDKTLRLFSVDGKENRKVQSVFFADMPITTANFIGDGNREVLCTGRRSFFYSCDLETGKVMKIPKLLGRPEKSLQSVAVPPLGSGSTFAAMGYDGNVLLISQKTKQWIGNLKMSGTARCASYTADGNYIYTSGDSGDVYLWDLRTRRCLRKHADEGSMGTRSLAVNQAGTMYAVGQTSGVVNIYDAAAAQGTRNPEPVKRIMNLTTPIDQLVFNHDGKLLSLLSRRKKEQLRLFHVPSLSVVANWPTNRTPIAYASCASFSPNGGFISIGNDKGKCLLYRLRHYSQA